MLGDQPWTIRALLRAGDGIEVIGETVYEWSRPHPDRYVPTITAATRASADRATEMVDVARAAFHEVSAEVDATIPDEAGRRTVKRAYFDRLVRSDLAAPVRDAITRGDRDITILYDAVARFVGSVPSPVLASSQALVPADPASADPRLAEPPAVGAIQLLGDRHPGLARRPTRGLAHRRSPAAPRVHARADPRGTGRDDDRLDRDVGDVAGVARREPVLEALTAADRRVVPACTGVALSRACRGAPRRRARDEPRRGSTSRAGRTPARRCRPRQAPPIRSRVAPQPRLVERAPDRPGVDARARRATRGRSSRAGPATVGPGRRVQPERRVGPRRPGGRHEAGRRADRRVVDRGVRAPAREELVDLLQLGEARGRPRRSTGGSCSRPRRGRRRAPGSRAWVERWRARRASASSSVTSIPPPPVVMSLLPLKLKQPTRPIVPTWRPSSGPPR